MSDISAPLPKPTVTRDLLRNALGELGAANGDVLYVHSSLASLGHMDGGAEAVVDALVDAVGPEGHVTAPTHSDCYRTPDGKINAFGRDATLSNTGRITETLRRRKGAYRSDHPTHSVAAVGPHADTFVLGHEPTGCTLALEGPHGKLTRANAKIVFLGCGLGNNTMFHAAEAWLDLPYLIDTQVCITAPDGSPREITTRHVPSGHRNFYGDADGGPLTRQLEQEGKVVKVMLNHTRLCMIHARDVIRIVCDAERRTPGSLLCDNPSCAFCHQGKRDCRLQHEQIIARAEKLLAAPPLTDPSAPPTWWF